MANIKSAEKRVRQTATRTQRNKSLRSRVKNSRRGALEALKSGDKAAAVKISELVSAADKAANRGVIHRNKANRIKARIARDAKKALRRLRLPGNSGKRRSKAVPDL